MTPPPAERFRPGHYLAPRYWPTWLAVGLLRLLILLPWPLLVLLGSAVGRLLYGLVASRRRVATINVRLCYPELSTPEVARIVRGSFESTALSLFEGALAWWGSERRLKRLYRIEGLEHYTALEGKGAILLGGHYTTLEISGRFLAFHIPTLQPVYKPAHNPLFDALVVSSRQRLFDDLLPTRDLRTIVRNIRQGKVVWYAPDQDFGRERSVFAPFMGVPTATLTTTARMARMTGAPLLPFYSERLPGGRGFVIRLEAPLAGFPSGDDLVDATRVNQVIEAQIRRTPAQYLWVHKRFKTRPNPDDPDLYAPKLNTKGQR